MKPTSEVRENQAAQPAATRAHVAAPQEPAEELDAPQELEQESQHTPKQHEPPKRSSASKKRRRHG